MRTDCYRPWRYGRVVSHRVVLPLVEPVRENETAPALEWLSEARLLVDRLSASVDGLRPVVRILLPVWDESPTNEVDLRTFLVRDHGEIVRRRDVVP